MAPSRLVDVFRAVFGFRTRFISFQRGKANRNDMSTFDALHNSFQSLFGSKEGGREAGKKRMWEGIEKRISF